MRSWNAPGNVARWRCYEVPGHYYRLVSGPRYNGQINHRGDQHFPMYYRVSTTCISHIPQKLILVLDAICTYAVLCTLYYVQCTSYTVRRALEYCSIVYSVQCTPNIVRCTHCTVYTLLRYSSLQNHTMLFTNHCTLYVCMYICMHVCRYVYMYVQ